jgi:hypothetical protein
MVRFPTQRFAVGTRIPFVHQIDIGESYPLTSYLSPLTC